MLPPSKDPKVAGTMSSAAEVAARSVADKHGNRPDALLEILHEIQLALECVPEDAVPVLANALNLSHAEVHGVVTFP